MEYCGVLVRPGIRNFCRRSSCPGCMSYACRSRITSFLSRSDDAPKHIRSARSWAAFSLPVAHFAQWRGVIHDRIRYRRHQSTLWQPFALVARYDNSKQRAVGVANLGLLGLLDLDKLLHGARVMPLPEDAELYDTSIDFLLSPASPMSSEPIRSLFLAVQPKRMHDGSKLVLEPTEYRILSDGPQTHNAVPTAFC